MRLPGLVAAGFVALVAIALGDVVALVPVGSLAGVMVIVVHRMFNWQTFPMVTASLLPRSMRRRFQFHRKISRIDAFLIVVVSLGVLLYDVAIAVGVGCALAAAAFAYQSAQTLSVVRVPGKRGSDRSVVYHLSGPLYYGTAEQFKRAFTPDADPPSATEVHFGHSAVHDFTALDALAQVSDSYSALGKTLTVKHLSAVSAKVLHKASHLVTSVSYDVAELDDEVEGKGVGHRMPLHVATDDY